MRPSSSSGRSAVGAYGKKLAERFRMADPPTIISRVLRKTEIGVFEFRCDNPALGQSGSIPPEDAYAVALQLRDYPSHHYWEEGRPAPIYSLKTGQTLSGRSEARPQGPDGQAPALDGVSLVARRIQRDCGRHECRAHR